MQAVRGIFLFLFAMALVACGERETESDIFEKAVTYENEENYQEAIYGYEKLASQFPEGPKAGEALQRAAFLYYNNVHDFQKAIELQERLIESHPESAYIPRARFMVGFIYANDLQDYDAAKESYNEFLQHHSDNELAESVKWELEHLGKDVDEQLLNLVGNQETDGEVKSN